jgi:hypothetical protein
MPKPIFSAVKLPQRCANLPAFHPVEILLENLPVFQAGVNVYLAAGRIY